MMPVVVDSISVYVRQRALGHVTISAALSTKLINTLCLSSTVYIIDSMHFCCADCVLARTYNLLAPSGCPRRLHARTFYQKTMSDY